MFQKPLKILNFSYLGHIWVFTTTLKLKGSLSSFTSYLHSKNENGTAITFQNTVDQ